LDKIQQQLRAMDENLAGKADKDKDVAGTSTKAVQR